jgi:hypothetical protein
MTMNFRNIKGFYWYLKVYCFTGNADPVLCKVHSQCFSIMYSLIVKGQNSVDANSCMKAL